MIGHSFTARKAPDCRWASRSLLCVSMLAASTSAATQELAGSCSSIWRYPRSAWKRPLVVLTDKTRIANDRCEWVGSISQIMVILLESFFFWKSCSPEWCVTHTRNVFSVACTKQEGRGVVFVTDASLSQKRPLDPLSL